MNAKTKLHQLHLQEWSSRFAEQKSSGLTVKQWCEQNNLSVHAYNYWKHQLKEAVVDQALPEIVPLSLPVIAPSDLSPSTSVEPPIRANCANRAIRTNHTDPCPQIRLSINGISIDLDPSVPEEFLFALVKAARYA